MKALTVKQHWADLIISGAKDIENRSWRTNYRGRIYIHASKFFIKENIIRLLDEMGTLSTITNEQYLSVLGAHYTSAIVGEVDIIDCVKNHPSKWAEKNCWNWVLGNSFRYDNPIKNVKGSLSFWNYDLPNS